jgi:hypothetical protein
MPMPCWLIWRTCATAPTLERCELELRERKTRRFEGTALAYAVAALVVAAAVR